MTEDTTRPPRTDWVAHGLAAMDELRRMYFEGSDDDRGPGHIAVTDWEACESAIRTALAEAATPDAGHPRTYSLVGSPHLFLVTDDESGINIGYADKIGGPLVAAHPAPDLWLQGVQACIDYGHYQSIEDAAHTAPAPDLDTVKRTINGEYRKRHAATLKNADETSSRTATFSAVDPMPVHDIGCRCWPHVSEKDALAQIAAVGLAEYRAKGDDE